MKTIIERPNYSLRVTPFVGTNLVKVFTGQRRVGKSYLMLQVMESLRQAGTHIIHIDKEKYEFDFIKSYVDLMDYIEQHKKEQNALFIDEIQDIDSFEKALRSLYNDPAFDIYITGSNATMLSGELATYLSGRYVEIRVHALSYAEFLVFHQQTDTAEAFTKYLQFGGLPNLIHLPLQASVVYDYLKNVYNTILVKDVIKRNQVRNVYFLENLVNYVADNIGSIVSSKRISDYLRSQKLPISNNTVYDYLGFLENSFFITKVNRAAIQGRKVFEIHQKYYFEDIGLRNAIVGYRPNDIHKLLENVVHNHLVINEYAVTIGVDGVNEIDFVAEKNGEKLYVQVCYLLQDPSTVEREFGNLLNIPDQYPKYVVSMDSFISPNTYRGIKHLTVSAFLLEIH
ncbi:MAG: ATP-binding protein [Runella slithyformis]|nr:MAG: ATP-binding protein [Runella slithyformis]TAF27529.1 MAG: ATP-binding protein [Runella slithyformis]TAF46042.1 MAG: ATP-binding protein [Runella slithyformis]